VWQLRNCKSPLDQRRPARARAYAARAGPGAKSMVL